MCAVINDNALIVFKLQYLEKCLNTVLEVFVTTPINKNNKQEDSA